MSNDGWKDDRQRDFISKWCPKTEGNGLPEVNAENLRWNIARANAAEDELQRLKGALETIMRVIQ